VLTAAERAELESLRSRRRTAQGLARRARIALTAAAEMENRIIAEVVGADEKTVGKWRRRFAERRADGLNDEPRPGAPRQIGDAEVAGTIRLTLETNPPAATHWSLRAVAAAGHAPSIFTASGRPSGCSRTGRKPSSCRAIRCSSTRCATSSASIWRRPSGRWCCASTRSRKSGRSTAPSPCCRCARAGRGPHARLHAAWHPVAVRRARCGDRQGDRALLRAP
jgi:transposase